MKRALILSSGASWGAYQIGALRHLITEQYLDFQIIAGTGIGAMNAAMVACGEFDALESFWKKIGWRKLISFNWRHPFRDGLFKNQPLREFLEAHVSEEKLNARGIQLVFSVLNLKSGEQVYFEYPGSDVPLIDALSGASAVPGMNAPFVWNEKPLVEGTFVNSFILDYILTTYQADEYYGIAALPKGDSVRHTPQKYTNWRKSLFRTMQLNLSRDVEEGIERARKKVEAIRAFITLEERLETAVRKNMQEKAGNQLYDKIRQKIFSNGFPLKRDSEPSLYVITTSSPIDFPLWSFRRKRMKTLMQMGYSDSLKLSGLKEIQV